MTATAPASFALEPAFRIQAILPNDGSDRRILEGLLRDKGVTRVDSVSVRAVAALAEAQTKRGRLPEPILARLITVIVPPKDADKIFKYIYNTGKVGRPGGGLLRMDKLSGATAYELPADVPVTPREGG